MLKSSRICNFLNSSSYLHIFVTLIFDILAKLQFMVWGSGAPGAPGAHGALGLPGLPDDEFVMNSKSEMACFAEGIKRNRQDKITFKGMVPQFFFYCSNFIFWIVMGCGIVGFGRRSLKII